jgi:sirohydrochlorin cobaltochelatase
MIAMGDKALILFAHGSRDPAWAEPFARLAEKVREKAPGRQVRLAFLESMRPDLAEVTAELIASGARSIHIVPIFFGQGGHVRRDVPTLIDALRGRHAGVEIACARAAGEDEQILDAIAVRCVSYLT